jgi:hypothetical protein
LFLYTGLDFTAIDVTLSLPSNSNNGAQVCQNISIVNDAVMEQGETFSVLAFFEEGVDPESDSAIVLILDGTY